MELVWLTWTSAAPQHATLARRELAVALPAAADATGEASLGAGVSEETVAVAPRLDVGDAVFADFLYSAHCVVLGFCSVAICCVVHSRTDNCMNA